MCIRAKATDVKHTVNLRLPDNTWERFSIDLSAKFEKSSIHSNYYQMAIIDVKSKYVWDFYLETKDHVERKKKSEILAKTQTTHKQQHISQTLVSAIIPVSWLIVHSAFSKS